MHRISSAATLATVLCTAATAFGLAGEPDPTFGVNGVAMAHFGSSTTALGTALVRQPDGKLVAAGSTSAPSSAVGLARFDAAGALDPGFGTAGVVTTTIGTAAFVAQLLLQPDGKLVAVGSTGPSDGDSDILLARYLPNGTLDATFGSGGVVVTSLGLGTDLGNAAALQADGKIVVTGSSAPPGAPAGTGSDSDLVVLRYDADGALDATFGIGGVVALDFSGRADGGAAVIVQPDGGIVVAGSSFDGPLFFDGSVALLVRLDSTGTLDPTFAAGGTLEIDAGLVTFATALVQQPDGMLVVLLGSSPPASTSVTWHLARYDTSGALDPSMTGAPLAAAPYVFVPGALVRQADGKLVVAGLKPGTSSYYNVGVARTLSDGDPDTTFAEGGATGFPAAGGASYATAAIGEPDGSIVVTGTTTGVGSGHGGLVVVRIRPASASCAVDSDCAVCERCGSAGVCESGARAGCAAAISRHGRIFVKEADNGVRDLVRFGWRGASTPSVDPISSNDVGLCMYRFGRRVLKAVTPAGATCGGGPCWRGSSALGLRYKDRDRAQDGFHDIMVKPGKVAVGAGGPELASTLHGLPAPFMLGPGADVLVQLHAGHGACIEAAFTNPAGQRVNVDDFRAKSD
ncbi:MAG: hypothetical protein U0807_11495 [Candidatus Binatia bacterium]